MPWMMPNLLTPGPESSCPVWSDPGCAAAFFAAVACVLGLVLLTLMALLLLALIGRREAKEKRKHEEEMKKWSSRTKNFPS